MQPENSKIKLLNKHEKILTATIMQLKFEHDYFKSYLSRLTNSSNKCHERCYQTQNPKYLLTNCSHFRNQQSMLIKKMKSTSIDMRSLVNTNKKLNNLIEYLKSTKLTTRKWILKNKKFEKNLNEKN